MSTDTIKIGTNEKIYIGARLLDALGGVDLTNSSVVFAMASVYGSTSYDIPCTLGGTVDGVTYAKEEGGVTIPMSSTYDSVAGDYIGQFQETVGDETKYYPNDGYIEIKIIPAL